MWLLPWFPRVAAFATETFYRTSISGGEIPRDGPVILVGNHPNSLLDPLFLAAVARRPVRFLAKAPLFASPLTAWAVNSVGAIPVYRPKDNPALVKQNASMFRAAHAALRAGDAVGIFPEGMSHDAPSLVPLRTGAARIALGARTELGGVFPIVPVGLILLNKEEFRSEAQVLIGEPVSWADLLGAEDSASAVKELTARIDAALRAVTLNLESRDDAALIHAAEQIYVAEDVATVESGSRVDRWRESARILSNARKNDDPEAVSLAREIRHHRDALELLRLRPGDLRSDPSLQDAARWSARRATLPLSALLAALGAVLFWAPYRATATLVRRAPTDGTGRASVKLVAGAGLFLLWIGLLAVLAWLVGGGKAGIAAIVTLPILALGTLALLEHWSDAWGDIRRFFLLRSRSRTLAELRVRQKILAERMRALRDRAVARA